MTYASNKARLEEYEQQGLKAYKKEYGGAPTPQVKGVFSAGLPTTSCTVSRGKKGSRAKHMNKKSRWIHVDKAGNVQMCVWPFGKTHASIVEISRGAGMGETTDADDPKCDPSGDERLHDLV